MENLYNTEIYLYCITGDRLFEIKNYDKIFISEKKDMIIFYCNDSMRKMFQYPDLINLTIYYNNKQLYFTEILFNEEGYNINI